MKDYDVLLFDADNTLFDYDKGEKQALRLTLESMGLTFDQALHSTYRKFNQEGWALLEEGVISKDEVQLRPFQKLFAFLDITADAAAVSHSYLLELGRQGILLDGAEELCFRLSQLQQIQ